MKVYMLLISAAALLVLSRVSFAQCFIVASEKHKRIMYEVWGVTVPDRQGNFSTLEECETYLYNLDADPEQKKEHWCDCDKQNTNESYESDNTQAQQQSRITIEDRETQLKKIKEYEMQKQEEKRQADEKNFRGKKQNVLGKIKRNTALDQLKTTEEVSDKAANNINVEDEAGRRESESSFTDSKMKIKHREPPTIPVSPPAPVNHQKNLFEYIDREKIIVQTRIMEVQKDKIGILEKKNNLQQKITEQTLNIEKLNAEKTEVNDENRKEEIDSLLLLAEQMLEESEDLNKKADQELQDKNKLAEENEALLNKFENAYNKSKEFPEQSEQLLNELRGGNK